MPLTTSQVDKLGDRLKAQSLAGEALGEDDRRQLLEVRASFLPAYQTVIQGIQDATDLAPSGRPEKTPESIIGKLVREGTKLSRMQDVAGCRLLVDGRSGQDEVSQRLLERFPDHRLVDRRENPSHGYRAVHIIVREQGRPVEIQVRTGLQHFWATLVERITDRVGGDLKHGVEPEGSPGLLAAFVRASDDLADFEVSGLDILAKMDRQLPDDLTPMAKVIYQLGLFQATMDLAIKPLVTK